MYCNIHTYVVSLARMSVLLHVLCFAYTWPKLGELKIHSVNSCLNDSYSVSTLLTERYRVQLQVLAVSFLCEFKHNVNLLMKSSARYCWTSSYELQDGQLDSDCVNIICIWIKDSCWHYMCFNIFKIMCKVEGNCFFIIPFVTTHWGVMKMEQFINFVELRTDFSKKSELLQI